MPRISSEENVMNLFNIQNFHEWKFMKNLMNGENRFNLIEWLQEEEKQKSSFEYFLH